MHKKTKVGFLDRGNGEIIREDADQTLTEDLTKPQLEQPSVSLILAIFILSGIVVRCPGILPTTSSLFWPPIV